MDRGASSHTLVVDDRHRIELVTGDITRLDVCAIVNAANPQLAPGGGVCGAIFSAAGSEPFAEAAEIVRTRGRLAPGQAVATAGGRLKARHIIHAVGPIWRGGLSGERESLASAYRESVRIADDLECASLAFPSISTGIYGFPLDIAAPIALETIRDRLRLATYLSEVIVVLYDPTSARAWREAAEDLGW